MKVFIVLTSLLAIALAGHYSHAYYPLHIPVIGHTGVPLESPEIIHARQAHLSHVAAVKSRQGAWGYGGYGYAGGYGGHYGGYAGGHGYPLIGHNGVPIDTPEVQAAKAAHFAAYQKAAAAAAHSGGYGHEHFRKRRGIYGYAHQSIGHNGVPLDTPEVQAAKAAHFAAHAKASSLHGGYASGIGGGFGGAYHYGGYSHAPLDHDGRVRDTPEVEALKAKHFEAHAAARSQIGTYGHGGAFVGGHGGGFQGGYEGAASAGHGHYHGPQHIPVITKHGVPLDTPEVAAARQYHLQALAEASSKSYGHGHGHYF